MEAFQSLPEGTLAELIDGIIYMSPSPTPFHQQAAGKLFFEIYKFVSNRNLGSVYFAPIDVYLDEERNAVQPDIIFVADEGRTTTSRKGIHGAPEFIIEIISPSNSTHDLVVKKEIYQRFGVKEYWIVNPESKETIGFSLDNGSFRSIESSPGKLNSWLFNQVFSF